MDWLENCLPVYVWFLSADFRVLCHVPQMLACSSEKGTREVKFLPLLSYTEHLLWDMLLIPKKKGQSVITRANHLSLCISHLYNPKWQLRSAPLESTVLGRGRAAHWPGSLVPLCAHSGPGSCYHKGTLHHSTPCWSRWTNAARSGRRAPLAVTGPDSCGRKKIIKMGSNSRRLKERETQD